MGGVSFRRYLVLLRTPPVGYLMATSMLARLPIGMTSLAIALMVTRSGSYRRAGAIIACNVVGAALAGPLMGRAVDRLGRARVLRPAALVEAGLMVLLALLPVRLPVLMGVCAAAAGLSWPPVVAATRSLWGEVVPADSQRMVFALEATLQEVGFLLGPVLVAALTALASPRAAVAATGLVTLAGVLAFTAHPATRVRPDRERETGRRRLGRPPVAFPLLVSAALVVGAFTACELATVAFARGRHAAAAAGLVLAVWSTGSLLAGLLYGGRAGQSRRPARRFAVLLAAIGAGLALPALASGMLTLALLLFVAGLAIAPSFAALYALVAGSAPAGAQTEAFGWLASCFQIGAALGAAAGGAVLQAYGPRPGYLLAAGAVGLIAAPLVLGWSRRRDRAPFPAAAESTLEGVTAG
jgi:MFS family permease